MKPSDVLEQLAADPAAGRGYGEPYQTPDGTTVIVVAKPLGVFAIRNGRATWTPAVDANRIALIGVITGLLAGVIGSLAVLRQPPWPRITIRDYR
ncbi:MULTISPECIES: hypothetical protein [Mycobacterium]|uniref:hypothetical protein n=1 Tax=Mycobacterium TaxID=1763 RepID=UPI00025D5FB4|nr:MULTISPECIES: hypothetical protein [Mycobacterium]AFJ37727.1 hypothetical protein W7S_23890 [Mycobacterium sp. MOTT36Y]AGP66315.1 hypothetical protein OEM_47800 [Mycobacterium intracellulare subsp. yongonense 05-1390]ASQ88591.1 hypothetical protein CE197_25605 [Mycobacterium intracellulare subsp. chimaera]ASX02587.1 hypothetical protein CKJ58_23460 [Mycobacterium intracellulare subsp. chimaera]ELR83299.1 hypothetical protein W7U_19840 [Mycobacterium sp. H4Y]